MDIPVIICCEMSGSGRLNRTAKYWSRVVSNMSDVQIISPESSQKRLTEALRKYVGLGRPYSVAAFAKETGIPERTIKSYQGGQATPGLGYLLRMMAVLPPEFADMLLSLAGLGNVSRTDHGNANSLAVHALASELNSLIAQALANDGIIDHKEEADMEPTVRSLQARCNAWLSRREHGSESDIS